MNPLLQRARFPQAINCHELQLIVTALKAASLPEKQLHHGITEET